MSRGRKPKSENTAQDWQEIFRKNIGAYFQTMIIELGKTNQTSDGSGTELLQKIKNERKNLGLKVNYLQKIKPDEVPFNISTNWVWCPLGEIIEFTDNLNIETKLSQDTLINYVDIEAVDNQKHIIRESKLKTVAELSSRARRVLKKGYLIYSLVRPYLNNIAIVEEDKPNHIGSTGFAVFNGILVNNRYLMYVLLSDYVRQLFLSMLSGFNSPTITQEQFVSTPIPLPPLSEQQKIVDFFTDFENNNLKTEGYYFNEEVEQKVINLHKSQLLAAENFTLISEQLTLIENLNQAILQEAVQGKLVPQDPTDEPASQLLERIKAEKAKTGKKEKPLPPIKKEEIPFEIPDNWVWCRLGEICDEILGGFAFDSTRYSKSETIHQVIRLGNVKPNQLVIETSPVFIDETYATEVSKALLQVNDVLITMTGTKAKKDYLFSLCLAPHDLQSKKLYLNQRVGCFRFGNNIYSEFINFVLKDSSILKPVFDSSTGAANQANIGMTALKEVLIPLPPLSEQQRIVAEIEKQLSKTKELKAHIIANQQATEQLLKALLHGAFEVEEATI